VDWGKVFLELWTHHRGKTVGIGIGFLFGLMVALLGFFEAVFISLCMVVGYFVGRRIDENIDFRDLIDRVFKDH